VKRVLILLVAMWLVSGCGLETTPSPTQTPDLVATQVAVMEAAAATLTAAAPTATATTVPSVAPTASPVLTVAPTATFSAVPTTAPPTAVEPTPPIGPALGLFAVVDVASDDVLNVRARPGPSEPVVGTIPYYGRGVEVHDGGRQVGESWWVPVRYGELSGWANGNYLARQVGNVGDATAARAAQIVAALRDRDMQELAGLAHPVKGVTFSPYTYVRPLQGAPGEADLVFGPTQLRGLWNDPTVYHWGIYDGSGEPIDLIFRDYYERFVYDVDFARPDVVGFNETIGQGNSINNIAEVYPIAVTIEYHFEGFDPDYAGMDWRSLRLVMEEYEGVWYLVGIVHDEWTI